MKRARQGVPAVPGTTPLASDVSMPPLVDEATAEATTELAQELATGAIDVDPAPVIDNPAAGADDVAIATGAAQAAAPVDQADELSLTGTSKLGGNIANIETGVELALRALEERVAALGLRIDVVDVRVETVEDRLQEIDGIVLTIDQDGNVTAADADLPPDRLAELRRTVLGVTVDMREVSPTHRAFPVLHEVLQDGRTVRPNSRDRVRLTEAEHREALAGGFVTLAWGDGDPVEDA